MGKTNRKRYNWESRQAVETVVDNSTTEKIKLDLDVSGGRYDESNALVLPSAKRKTKVKARKGPVQKILSKKHRKRLEQIVDKKAKKANRAALLESLAKVQATPEELSQLTSLSHIQTKGLKRYYREEELKLAYKESGEVEIVPNAIRGAKRRRIEVKPKYDKDDPNVVGLDTESDSDLESEPESVKDEPVEVVTEAELVEPPSLEPQAPEPPVPKPPEAKKLKAPKPKIKKPAVFVDVYRDEAIQQARLKLPILAEEQQIMEIINENPVVLIAGETGSGKTTQVPQFLYEAGYALNGKKIAVTEPRRVAAISMSKRVGEEMNLGPDKVSYLIRFEGNATENTEVKFMTDGVLLKELQQDFLLSKYSVVILDEAHERSVYTDVLIGLLSRIVPLRKKRNDPLKLIIMSATLRIQDFTQNKKLFKVEPPVVKVEARQFPVTAKFARVTRDDYPDECLKKVKKIHTKMPGDGGILVFLTGQMEVNTLVRKLRKAFPLRNKKAEIKRMEENPEENAGENAEDRALDRMQKKNRRRRKVMIVPKIDLEDYSLPDDDEEGGSGSDNGDVDSDDEITPTANASPLWVVPLYSMLPSEKQAEVFKPPPRGYERLCVVSTNVAETSLTIPGIKYVVDSGKTKAKLYDKATGVTTYAVTWTSKASAEQRAGRAGRTGPGHCFRLYSSAVYNDLFPEFTKPEIEMKPIDDLYLQMKCMHIDRVVNFPFVTSPDLVQLGTAEKRLAVLGALDAHSKKVTDLGREIAKYPVLPRFGKMLALSHQFDLLPYTVCIVAALSVQEVLLEKPLADGEADRAKDWLEIRQRWADKSNFLLLGDVMVLLKAVGAAEYANSQGKLQEFCENNGLRPKAVIEIRKLRLQLSKIISENFKIDVVVDPQLKPPSDVQAKLLRQILLSGTGIQVARKLDGDEIKDSKEKKKMKYAYCVPGMEERVFMHQNCVLRRTLPEYVIYQELYETNRIYMRGVTAIEPEWLPIYVPAQCQMGEPLTDPEPHYKNGKIFCKIAAKFANNELPLVEMEYPECRDKYKWFARFLLQGEVFPKLKKFAKNLLSTPGIMVKSWAKLQPRTVAVLDRLIDRRISSRESLLKAWGEEEKYLLEEYLKWVPETLQSEVAAAWPPL